MIRKKFLHFILAAVLVIGTATACSNETEIEENDTTEITENTEDTAGIQLTDGTKSLYKIIRAEEATQDMVDYAVELRRGLEETTGVKFEFGTDWVKKNETPDENAYEILVGMTNRTASQEMGEELSAIEYGVKTEGNKIVVYGSNAKTLEAAVDLFLKEDMLKRNAAGNYVLIIGAPKVEKLDVSGNEIPPYESDKIELYTPSTDTQLMKISDTTAEGYQEYLKMLEAYGFELYAENKIENNLFATYISDKLTVNVYYIDSNKITRIVWEPRGALPTLEADNKWEDKGVETLITNIDLETSMFYEGSSHVIRLRDNSFIIFDGGASDPEGNECRKMWDVLTSQTPEGEKPVIAAWIFSHCHGDHLGLMGDFLRLHKDDIIIEQFIYNFPTDEEILNSGDAYMLDDSHFRYTAFRNSKNEYFPDVPVVKPHTGNKFYIRNATIEIVGTGEDICPANIITHGMNASTVFYRMELEGQTIMWLGDAAVVNCDMAVDQFGDYLKADIMTVAHHGYGGGTVELYQTIDPKYVIYPVAAESYPGNYPKEDNLWLLEKSENVEIVMSTGFGTYIMRMPFSVEPGKYDRCQSRRGSALLTYVNPEYFN